MKHAFVDEYFNLYIYIVHVTMVERNRKLLKKIVLKYYYAQHFNF